MLVQTFLIWVLLGGMVGKKGRRASGVGGTGRPRYVGATDQLSQRGVQECMQAWDVRDMWSKLGV